MSSQRHWSGIIIRSSCLDEFTNTVANVGILGVSPMRFRTGVHYHDIDSVKLSINAMSRNIRLGCTFAVKRAENIIGRLAERRLAHHAVVHPQFCTVGGLNIEDGFDASRYNF